MKLLVIGIDGGDRRVFEAMPMSTVNALMRDGVCLGLDEDVWSRGWAEILSGQHGRDTGAFYSKPKLGGPPHFIQSFNATHYQQDHIKPLWELCNERGIKSGFMNIPTTAPAPKVDGFFVSGAGGGSKKSGSSDAQPEQVYPPGLEDDLKQHGYILDTRFQASGIIDGDTLRDRLIEMTRSRADNFTRLCQEYEVDFGFIANRSITVMQYLAMGEIEPMVTRMEMEGAESTRDAEVNDWQSRAIALYQCFDETVKQMIYTLQPEHVMLVADHGTVPYLHKVNINALLSGAGLIRNQASSHAKGLLKRTIKSLLPVRTIKKLAKKNPGIASRVTSRFDWSKSQAFGTRYVSGVYVNDQERFGGPVTDPAEIDRITDRVVEQINNNEESKKYGISARPYRRNFPEAKYNGLLPDVWVDIPDTMFFEGDGPYVSRNKMYGPVGDLKSIGADVNAGLKGKAPLFCINKEAAALVKDDDPSDLTLAYQLIDRLLA